MKSRNGWVSQKRARRLPLNLPDSEDGGEREALSVKGEENLARLVRDLEKSIEQAIARSPQVEECLSRVRAEGYEASLILQATLAFAPRGQLNQERLEKLAGLARDTEARFRMSSLDKKFLRSLKIAVDDDGS